MILTILTIIGVGLVALSTWPYIRSVLSGQVRPRLVSWGIWTVLAVIMTIAALSEGQMQSALLTGVTAASCGVIVVLGWRQGNRTVTRIDWICLAGAVAGIVAFLVIRDVMVALVISVAVDAVAFIPTLAHAWNDPEEESLTAFAMAASGEVFVIVAAVLEGATFAGLLYPVYAVLFNGATAVVILVGRRAANTLDYSGDEA
ncbi:MAG: hypothetical protein WBP12_05205 [Candidatus Saccharimonas sp.]